MSSSSNVPIAQPSPSANIPTRPDPLSGDEKSKYETVLNWLSKPEFAPPLQLSNFKSWHKWAHSAKASSTDPPCEIESLSEQEKCFLTQEQILRFLRAVRWDTDKAISRAEETIIWRRDFRVDTMTAEEVEPEALTGKELVLGYDVESRPCLYMHPYRQNTKVSQRQIQFAVWVLERTIDLMPPGIEKLALLIDFGAGRPGGGGQPTTLGQARQVLNILQTYYCERLGRAICVNVPFVFWGFYKLVGPFIDPVTRDKIRFNPDTRELVPPEQLEKDNFGGDLDFKYVHDEYFAELDKLAKERKDAQLERFKQLGGKIGTSEWLIRGGNDDTNGNKPDRKPSERSECTTTNTPSTPSPSLSPTESFSTAATTISQQQQQQQDQQNVESAVSELKLDDNESTSKEAAQKQ